MMRPANNDSAQAARARRETEAFRYKPDRIDLLLVAEAPPASLDRYFYFDDVSEQDSLFRYVCRGVLGKEEPASGERVPALERPGGHASTL